MTRIFCLKTPCDGWDVEGRRDVGSKGEGPLPLVLARRCCLDSCVHSQQATMERLTTAAARDLHEYGRRTRQVHISSKQPSYEENDGQISKFRAAAALHGSVRLRSLSDMPSDIHGIA